MAKLVNSVIELIGETPIVKLNEIVPENAADVYVKLEYFNAGGSVKDRIAKNLIIAGEEAGVLKEGDTIIEASSGNTGVGLALVAATKKYSLVIVLPQSVSNERKQLIRAFGAEVIETPAPLGIKGSFAEVEKLIAEKGYISLRQFENKHNPEAHYKTTGPEILAAFDNVLPDAFVSGVGTGGTITGTGKFLKEHKADIKIVAVEPEKSPVLSGGVHSPHAIQGIGAGIVPEILDTTIYDEIIQVKDESAIETIQNLAAKEGLLLGVSSGAAIFAAIQVAEKLGKGKKVVVVAPDNGERYLSVGLF